MDFIADSRHGLIRHAGYRLESFAPSVLRIAQSAPSSLPSASKLVDLGMTEEEKGAKGKETPMERELLEQLRRNFPLRIDAQGRLFFEEDPVEHPRVLQYLRRHIESEGPNELRIRVGDQWAAVQVEDCPILVRHVEEDSKGQLLLQLNDGRTLPLDPDTLVEDRGRGLRCSLPSYSQKSQIFARFSNTAQMDLSPFLSWDDGEDKGPYLELGGRNYPIPMASQAEPQTSS